MNPVHEAAAEAQRNINMKIEWYCRMHVRRPPRWCPERLWFWLATRFLTIEISPFRFTEEP